MQAEVAAATDVGAKRDHNEDAYLLWDLAERRPMEEPLARLEANGAGLLLAVSDGMGGARSGEVASRTVVEALEAYALETFHPAILKELGGIRSWLGAAVEMANRLVHDRSESDGSLRGMGATLTIAALGNELLGVAHVGDSRAYLLRDARLRQLTMDQTQVQELVSIGRLSAEEARTDRRRNVLLQAVGTADQVEVDDFDLAVEPGDRILLCSDGLHGLVTDGEITDVLGSAESPDSQCRRLVALANARGGDDNITVVVAHLSAAAS